MKETRDLKDLISVGPAMIEDFRKLGITRVAQLRGRDPRKLYDRLCRITGERQDPCVLDVFHAAVAQADNPNLPHEKCRWHYWSRLRKSRTVQIG
jgi:hypothetical protein